MTAGPRWADIHDAFLAKLPTLTGWDGVSVYDGYPISGEQPKDSVTVGFVTDDGAGTFGQTWDPSGFGTSEAGAHRSMIRCNDGDTDPTVARARAFALFTAWQQWLASDQTLGGLLSEQTVITLSADVHSVQDAAGSATGLLVTATYQTVTFTA